MSAIKKIVKSDCIYPCQSHNNENSEAEQKKYEPMYNRTDSCRCCDKSSDIKPDVSHSEESPKCDSPKIFSNEPGPYTPGEIVNKPSDSDNVTTPNVDRNACPCPEKQISENEKPFLTSTVTGSTRKVPCGRNISKTQKDNENVCRANESDLNIHKETPNLIGNGPCYTPQPQDQIAIKEGKMGPIGPWATGRVDWGPLAGLTGTRPVVDKYTITRFSEGEWRARNGKLVQSAQDSIQRSNLADCNGRQCIELTRAEIDKNQEDTTTRLRNRAQEILRWKCELEKAIAMASDEIDALEAQRSRLKQAGSVLNLPELIVGESMDRRTGRLDAELVRDEVEVELIKEYSLIAEIRDLFNRTLNDLNLQMAENKNAKQRLEFDWSDKKVSCEVDSINAALTNRSNIIMFKPGATRFQDEQATYEHWEYFTRETIAQAEKVRQKSIALRESLDAILINSARDLRSQADRVDNALTKKITCTDELRDTLETKLLKILQETADLEKLMNEFEGLIRRLDSAMKVAQTRLDNRTARKRVEDCRDPAQYGLIDEVKLIGDKVSAVKAQLQQTKDAHVELSSRRGELELNILMLRKTLEIDRARIGKLRSFYPSAAALMGKA